MSVPTLAEVAHVVPLAALGLMSSFSYSPICVLGAGGGILTQLFVIGQLGLEYRHSAIPFPLDCMDRTGRYNGSPTLFAPQQCEMSILHLTLTTNREHRCQRHQHLQPPRAQAPDRMPPDNQQQFLFGFLGSAV